MVGLSVLSARLIQIQLVDRHHYEQKAQREYRSVEKLTASRGEIVDRNEETLAKSIPVASVMVNKDHLMDPKIISYGLAYQQASGEPGWKELTDKKQRQRINVVRGEILDTESVEVIQQKYLAYVVGILARPLGMRRDQLHEKIAGNKGKWFAIAKDINQDIADNLREITKTNWIDGIEFENSLKRWYTAEEHATHLTGFTGEAEEKDATGKVHTKIVGRFGIEASMNEFLAGRDGWSEQRRDARGLVVPGDSGSLKPPRAGLNVKLTIDMGIQNIVEEELDAALAEFRTKKGAVVLMDPKTGEILALVSRPNFNLNRKENLAENGFNYAIQAINEPGSVIKIVSASGAMNEGLVTPLTSINCFNGFYQGRGFKVTDEHPAGYLTVEGVLQKSNNNGAYNLGRQIGSKRFYQYLHEFGFGKKTGIQLSGESSGMARNTNNEADFSRACYGYATSVTTLQVACAYSVIAGDGKLRKPHIVKSLIANDGTIVEDYKPEVVGTALKPRAAAQMRGALEKIVQKGGTGVRAAVPGFRVAGKTGTAEKHNPLGGYFKGKKITTFAGMMPAQDPAFVCVVVVDEPSPTAEVPKPQGGNVSAPIFGKIATRVASHMNLQPTEPVTTPLAATNR